LVLETISGMRGIFGQDLTVDYARGWASRFAAFQGSSDIAVGCDTRASSQLLLGAVSEGLSNGGCTVHRLGLATTPELFRYVRTAGLRGGVMVTASHNPPEWNGLKFVTGQGRGINESELDAVRRAQPFSAPGRIVPSSSSYYDDIIRRIGEGGASGVRVALDLGGGSATKSAPTLFKRLGAEVHSLNFRPGVFSRPIDPTEDPLVELCKTVASEGCDVGFAFDGDGDRLVVVSPSAGKLPPDSIFSLMVLELAHPSDVVVVSVDTSSAVSEIAIRKGAKVTLAPVGEGNVVAEMLRAGADLGGEGSSGGVIFPEFSYCRDGLLAAATLTKALKGRELAEILADIPSYHVERLKMEANRLAFEKALLAIRNRYPDAVTLDGVRIQGMHGWILYRPSRTENVVRVSVEVKERRELAAAIDEAKSVLAGAVSEGLGKP
jgi:phosphomannomutase